MDFILAIFAAFLVVVLLAISVIDARSLRIPNWATAALLAVGVAYTAYNDSRELVSNLSAGMAAYAFMALLSNLYRRTRGVEGLGLGDAKLLGAFGVWVGAFWIAPIIFGASLMAIVFVLLRKAFVGTSLNRVVPFGPFLCVAFLFCWWAGHLAATPLRGAA